ncbi:MAG: 4'-phosphopantetheinyl transferase superfamily protein [Nitriliruptorales bacterium]|nr:4'-phosphopantetheinyl transferase superfamily protein [Nitriliruptorales bacterium]
MRVGCDVVDIERFTATVQRRDGFLERVFTERELGDARRAGVELDSGPGRARLAARFAAKEATRKALGDLRLPFHATEVRTSVDGAPELWLRDERSDLSLSLSHDGGVAMAVVVGPPAVTPDHALEGASHAARR